MDELLTYLLCTYGQNNTLREPVSLISFITLACTLPMFIKAQGKIMNTSLISLAMMLRNYWKRYLLRKQQQAIIKITYFTNSSEGCQLQHQQIPHATRIYRSL